MEPPFAIIEGYPEGGTWTHYFWTELDARWNLEALREAHRGREYVTIGFDEG